MQHVISTDYYSISIDKAKNRMYLKLVGFWKTPDLVPNYPADLEKAGNMLPGKYTLVTDLTELAAIPVALNPVHHKAQEMLLKTGQTYTAEIVDNPVMKSVSKSIADTSGMKKKEFADRASAERWLDEQAVAV